MIGLRRVSGFGCGVGVLCCRVGWLPVGLDVCLLQIGFAWLQIGQASGKAGWQLSADRGCLAAEWAGLQ